MNHVIVKLLQGAKHVRAKRIPKGWLTKTVIAQQARINDLEQAVAGFKAERAAQVENSKPGATELAPSAIPEANPA